MGFVLPKHIASAKHISKGDVVYVNVVRPENTEAFDEFMSAVEQATRRYPNTLKALAD